MTIKTKEAVYSFIKDQSDFLKTGELSDGIFLSEIIEGTKIPEIDLRPILRELEMETRIYQREEDRYASY